MNKIWRNLIKLYILLRWYIDDDDDKIQSFITGSNSSSSIPLFSQIRKNGR
jgi:hypothetical protein